MGEMKPPASRPDAMQCTGNSEDTRHQKGGAKACWSREKTTIGWLPTCACNAEIVPCTVLDIFGGAGTTGMAADRLGRDAILIELNPEYAEMARQRLALDAGPMFGDVRIEAAPIPEAAE